MFSNLFFMKLSKIKNILFLKKTRKLFFTKTNSCLIHKQTGDEKQPDVVISLVWGQLWICCPATLHHLICRHLIVEYSNILCEISWYWMDEQDLVNKFSHCISGPTNINKWKIFYFFYYYYYYLNDIRKENRIPCTVWLNSNDERKW